MKNYPKKRRSDIYIADTNATVKPIAFNAKKSDGFNPHLVVNDEMAAWRGDAGLKQYEVMKSALGARKQPLILSISTAGYENNGIFDELMKRASAVLKGSRKETRLFPIGGMMQLKSAKQTPISECLYRRIFSEMKLP